MFEEVTWFPGRPCAAGWSADPWRCFVWIYLILLFCTRTSFLSPDSHLTWRSNTSTHCYDLCHSPVKTVWTDSLDSSHLILLVFSLLTFYFLSFLSLLMSPVSSANQLPASPWVRSSVSRYLVCFVWLTQVTLWKSNVSCRSDVLWCHAPRWTADLRPTVPPPRRRPWM